MLVGGAVTALVVVLAALAAPASGQVATSCTGSQLVTSFTPCLNFVTGSTNGGGSPTRQCCNSVAEMVRTAADCACLIFTGNVPFSLPINRTLAVSLPKLCNSMSVPLQCRGLYYRLAFGCPKQTYLLLLLVTTCYIFVICRYSNANPSSR